MPADLAYALKLVDKSPFIYNPGAFQSAIFVLGPGSKESVYEPSKNRISISYNPMFLLDVSFIGFWR